MEIRQVVAVMRQVAQVAFTAHELCRSRGAVRFPDRPSKPDIPC